MSDLSAALRDEVMRAFIEAPRDGIRYPPRMEASQAVRERERRLASRPWHWGLEHPLYVLRAWRWLAWSRQRHPPAPAPASAAPGGAARARARSIG